MSNVNLTQVSTHELSAELSRREGVKYYVYGPEDYVFIANSDGEDVGHYGPATVLINID
ncbi:non-homologous end joining protein Ku [Paenibacillus sp. DS2015]|uniref:BC1881 family protein n=1 Tax=Paenibacillus sp. DS2015 TaxID=3373917 RepID=UPI003D239D6F